MILKFIPILKPAIWGGDKLLPYKRMCADAPLKEPIGESWEISGLPGHSSIISGGEFDGLLLSDLIKERSEQILGKAIADKYGPNFPLLLKFIDTSKELSVQVHPDDELAAKRHNSNGKAEMWLILKAEKGAFLRSGFNRSTTFEEYETAVRNNDICSLLRKFEITPGDVFFIPPGCIHNIGPGVFLIELQQSADITYRIYDFDRRDCNGNLRELHKEMARDAIDFDLNHEANSFHINHKSELPTEVIRSKFFKLFMDYIKKPVTLDLKNKDEFFILTCIEGSGTLRSDNGTSILRCGETALITADTLFLEIIPDQNSPMRILSASV